MSRRVLMITYHFSPSGITSSRRPGGMAKYLPEFGWEPIVVTRMWRPDNCNYDPTIVPNLPPHLIRYEVSLPRSARLSGPAMIDQAVRFMHPSLHPYSFLRAGRPVIDQLIARESFDAIWTTVPHSNLLDLAHYASRRSAKPWIADFRDVWQWVPNLFARLTLGMRIAHERRLLKSAAAITAVSNGFARTLEERHGRPVHPISHGFDPDLLPSGRSVTFPRFNIVFTGGVILGDPDLRILLDVVGRLIKRGEINESDIAIEFYGAGNGVRLAQMFSGHPFARIVTDHGPVPRAQVTECQRNAAILLCASHPGIRGWNTSKMFEYIAAGRPILSIPRDHDCIDALLSETCAGVSCTSAEEIELQLLKFYREWKHTGTIAFHGRPEAISRYSNRIQAGELASLLNKVVERS